LIGRASELSCIQIIKSTLEYENGKSDDWFQVNDSVDDVSTKLVDEKESMPTVTDHDVIIWSDKKFSFENE
jgi:hypothetical protein